MEIDITDFVRDEDPYAFSASIAEMGNNASKITWGNAMGYRPPMLTTEEQLDALRQWAKDTGAWDEEERNAWTDQECNALFVQIISGDLRELEALCSDDNGEIDWDKARELSEEGQIRGCIYPCDRPEHKDFSRIFYYLGS